MNTERAFRGFTKEELDDAFTKVHNKENWKLPIKATVKTKELRKTITAIEFFCGGGVKIVHFEPLKATIEHPGYYVVIGA